jgi:hypothetical protein
MAANCFAAIQLAEQLAIALTSCRKPLIHECVIGQRRITEADGRRAQTKGNNYE